MNIKIKFNIFSHNKLKFQPRTKNYSVKIDVRFCSMRTVRFNVNVNMNCSVY